MNSYPGWIEFGSSFISPNGQNFIIYTFNPWSLVIMLAPLYLLRRKGKSAGYLLCFTLFFLYAWAAFDLVVCPLPITRAMIEFERYQSTWAERVNLIPGSSLHAADGSFCFDTHAEGNLLLGVPFGCLFPLLIPMPARRFVPIAFAFGVSLELIQLFIGLAYGFAFRSIDVDDSILAFLGALFGYALLRLAALLYRRLYRRGLRGGARVPVWEHFHEVMLALSPSRPEEKTT